MTEDPLPAPMLACLRELEENLAYIRRELPTLGLPEEPRRTFPEICDALAKDVDALRSAAERILGESPPAPGAVNALRASIRAQATKLDGWVMAARALGEAEPRCMAVTILLEESGANMLLAYMGIRRHLDALEARPPQG